MALTQTQLRTLSRQQLTQLSSQQRQQEAQRRAAEAEQQRQIQAQQQVQEEVMPSVEEEAQAMASGWVQRKMAGKRIVTSSQGLTGREAEVTGRAFRLYQEMLKDKGTRMAVSAGSQAYLAKEFPGQYVSQVRAERAVSQEAMQKQLSPGETALFRQASGTLLGIQSSQLTTPGIYSTKEYAAAVGRHNIRAAEQIAATPVTSVVQPKPNLWQRVIAPINTANIRVSEWLTRKGITAGKVQSFLFGGIQSDIEKSRIGEEAYYKKYPWQKGYEEYTLGVSTGVIEKPVTSAAMAGLFFVAPSVISKVAKVPFVTKALTFPLFKGTAFATTGETLITGGLVGSYAGSVHWRISSTIGPYEKGLTTGRILGTEIIPGVVGGYAAAKILPRVETWFKPTGEKLPKIVKEAVIKQKGIPQVPVERHLGMFTSRKYAPKGAKAGGYSLTAGEFLGRFKDTTGKEYFRVLTRKELLEMGIAAKKREATALFLGPYPSIHFARLPGEPTFYGGTFGRPFESPTGLYYSPKGFKIAGISKGEILVPKGYAGVPGKIIGKPEPQALVPSASLGEFTGKVYSMWYKGYKLTFEEVQAFGMKGGVGLKGTGVTPSLSYYGPGKSSITTPSSYLLGVSSSIKVPPSSAISSVAPSKVPSPILSAIVSYKPSKAPSPIISYIPIYKPSYTPSKIPSYPISKISKPLKSYLPSYTPPPIPPPPIPPPIPPPSISTFGKPKAKSIIKDIFEAVSRRRGKEITLGKYGTQTEAERKLMGFLKGTLAASGKVLKGGQPLKVSELKEFWGREFAPAKRDIFRVIQKRGFRLSTRPEVTEIKFAKRTSGRRKRLRWM